MCKLSRSKEGIVWTRQFYAAQSLFTADRSEKGVSDQAFPGQLFFRLSRCTNAVALQALPHKHCWLETSPSHPTAPHMGYTHSLISQTSKWIESTFFPSLRTEQNAQVDKARLGVCEENTLNASSVRPTLDINQGWLQLQAALSSYLEKIFTVPGLNYRNVNTKKRNATS